MNLKKKDKVVCFSSNNSGLTIVEMLLSMLILGFTLGVSMYLYVQCTSAINKGANTSVALNHAKIILEEMRILNDLSDITDNADWALWASNNGLDMLDDETINVTYPQGTSADPLEVLVTVGWNDIVNLDTTVVSRSISVSTQITER